MKTQILLVSRSPSEDLCYFQFGFAHAWISGDPSWTKVWTVLKHRIWREILHPLIHVFPSGIAGFQKAVHRGPSRSILGNAHLGFAHLSTRCRDFYGNRSPAAARNPTKFHCKHRRDKKRIWCEVSARTRVN